MKGTRPTLARPQSLPVYVLVGVAKADNRPRVASINLGIRSTPRKRLLWFTAAIPVVSVSLAWSWVCRQNRYQSTITRQRIEPLIGQDSLLNC